MLQNGVFWGEYTPSMVCSINVTLKGTSLCSNVSYDVKIVKIHPRMWAGCDKQRLSLLIKGRSTPKIAPFYLGISTTI